MATVFLVILILYTALLLVMSAYSKRKAQNAGQFLDGGRKFGSFRVSLLMTAMWGASMFSLAIDAGYLHGLSAIWLGISTIGASLFVASFMLKPFRKIGYLTNSNLIGRKYGTKARDFSALVIGLTFPIFAMKDVLAAASFLHAILGWNLPIVLIATTLLIILYVSLGGLWSLAYVQILNLILFTAGLVVAAYFGLRNQEVFTHPVPEVHGFHSPWGIGLDMIMVWFGMSLLNSVSAQAELQTIAAAKDVKKGKLGVFYSSIPLLGFAIIPVLLGMVAREHVGSFPGGLLAFPVYLESVAPHWALIVVGVGFWAAALIWCAPLMFSGASSFGLDFFNRKGVSHNTSAVRRFTRLSMIIQGILIIVYAVLRPGNLAWWGVFGLTLRNAAVVGPTISFLLWPAVKERTIIFSMIFGVFSGFGWNAVTGFSASVFLLGINPMWVGSGISMLTIIIGTFIENQGKLRMAYGTKKFNMGVGSALSGAGFFVLSIFLPGLHLRSLLSVDLFLVILTWFFAAMLMTEEIDGNQQQLQSPSDKLEMDG